MSSPSLPLSVSAPIPPLSVSLPALPVAVSSPLPPVRVSFADDAGHRVVTVAAVDIVGER
jgi:hypothetical protein